MDVLNSVDAVCGKLPLVVPTGSQNFIIHVCEANPFFWLRSVLPALVPFYKAYSDFSFVRCGTPN